MDSALKQILPEFEELKGQHIITQSHTIERLLAVGTDDDDYYWVTYDGRKVTWHSCVGRIIPLKGYLKDKDYVEFIRLAKLNHFDQIEVISEEASRAEKARIKNIKLPDKFLTEICWDLN